MANLVKIGHPQAVGTVPNSMKNSARKSVSVRLSKNISEIVYWLILLLFLPIVLFILGLKRSVVPLFRTWSTDVVSYSPNIFIAASDAFVGAILSKIVRGIVEGLLDSLNVPATC